MEIKALADSMLGEKSFHFTSTEPCDKNFCFPVPLEIPNFNDQNNIEIEIKQIISSDEIYLEKISSDTLHKILSRFLNIGYILLDCRSEKQFNKGHIDEATLASEERVVELFNQKYDEIPLLILYCNKFNSRCKVWGKLIRQYDRSTHDYPIMTFPKLLLLQGGYKSYYKKFEHDCSRSNENLSKENQDKKKHYGNVDFHHQLFHMSKMISKAKKYPLRYPQ